jgi:hypothetical protein
VKKGKEKEKEPEQYQGEEEDKNVFIIYFLIYLSAYFYFT